MHLNLIIGGSSFQFAFCCAMTTYIGSGKLTEAIYSGSVVSGVKAALAAIGHSDQAALIRRFRFEFRMAWHEFFVKIKAS